MTPLPSCFSRLLRNTADSGAQHVADTSENVRVITFNLRTDRCVALNRGHLCGAKGSPLCSSCRGSFGRTLASEGR